MMLVDRSKVSFVFSLVVSLVVCANIVQAQGGDGDGRDNRNHLRKLSAGAAESNTITYDDGRALLTELEESWHITKPVFTYSGLSFDLEYHISKDVLQSSTTTTSVDSKNRIGYKVYDSHQCKNGGRDITLNNGYLTSTVLTQQQGATRSTTTTTDEDSVTVTLTIDPNTIKSTSLYETTSDQLYANIYFCVRFSLYHNLTSTTGDTVSSNANNEIEVNYVETPVLLEMNFVSDFALISRGSFTNGEILVEMAQSNTALVAYLCDTHGTPVTSMSVYQYSHDDPQGIEEMQELADSSSSTSVSNGTSIAASQEETTKVINDDTGDGTIINICIAPTNITLEQGASILTIESLTISRKALVTSDETSTSTNNSNSTQSAPTTIAGEGEQIWNNITQYLIENSTILDPNRTTLSWITMTNSSSTSSNSSSTSSPPSSFSLCQVTTIVNADFFQGTIDAPVIVSADGAAYLQIGGGSGGGSTSSTGDNNGGRRSLTTSTSTTTAEATTPGKILEETPTKFGSRFVVLPPEETLANSGGVGVQRLLLGGHMTSTSGNSGIVILSTALLLLLHLN